MQKFLRWNRPEQSQETRTTPSVYGRRTNGHGPCTNPSFQTRPHEKEEEEKDNEEEEEEEQEEQQKQKEKEEAEEEQERRAVVWHHRLF